MTAWSIEVTLDLGHRATAEEAIKVEEIAAESLAVSATPSGLVANAWHDGPRWVDADEYANKLIWKLTNEINAEIVGVRVRTAEQVEAEIARPTLPRLLGASEVSEMLQVTRQRVHQLYRENSAFPAPLVEVAMGPLWDERAVEKFARNWARQAGRPRSNHANGPVDLGRFISKKGKTAAKTVAARRTAATSIAAKKTVARRPNPSLAAKALATPSHRSAPNPKVK